jgi:hypothetical protein
MSAEAKGLRISNEIAEETSESYIKALNAEYLASSDINSPFTEDGKEYIPASVLKSRMDALSTKWQFDKRYWTEGLNALGTIGNTIGNVGNLRKRPAPNTYIYGNRTYNRY